MSSCRWLKQSSIGYLVSRANLNLSYTLEDIKAVAPPPESLSRLLKSSGKMGGSLTLDKRKDSIPIGSSGKDNTVYLARLSRLSNVI